MDVIRWLRDFRVAVLHVGLPKLEARLAGFREGFVWSMVGGS